MVTITDIANACGVSRATVSKALNGAPDVSRETADRIRETAASLGYLLSEAQGMLVKAPWYAISTGAMIALLVFGVGLIGEGLQKLEREVD